jgi:hypothetical protein
LTPLPAHVSHTQPLVFLIKTGAWGAFLIVSAPVTCQEAISGRFFRNPREPLGVLTSEFAFTDEGQ